MSRNRYLPPSLLLSVALLAGCGGGGDDPSPAPLPVQPPSSSLSISAVLDPDKTYEVGDLAAGWLMRVPQGALGDQPTTLEMRTTTEAELKTLGVPPDARVLSLTANGQHNVRLQELVEIAAQIPPKLKQASPWELMYGYHTANGWEYWPFKDVDMAAGVAVIEMQHFSWTLEPVQPSTAERLTVYSRTMAAQYTQKELSRQALVQKLGPDLEQTLASLGVTDRAVIKNLSTNMIAYLESAHIDYALTANAALSPLDSIARIATGNEDERKEKSLEITARALHWALAKGGPGKWPANAIGSFGSLGTAVGALAGGDSEAAGNAIYSVLKGVISTAAPHAGLVFLVGEAAVGSVLNAVDAFTASELEKAYQVYAGHSSGKGYYDEGSGDIEALLEQMAGGGRQQETRILANYCAKRAISPCELDQPEREYALDKGRESLKAYFVQRKANEEIYKTFELQEKEFVAELEKDAYLLNDSSFNKYFGDGDGGLTFDIEDRLLRIYRVRSSLREIFNGPNAAKMTHRDMVLAIRFWMTNKVNKTVPKFYEWAIEQGYTSSSFKTDVVIPPLVVTSTFKRTVIASDLTWTTTISRAGELHANTRRFIDGASWLCNLEVNWILPTAHSQPLAMTISRSIQVDGIIRNVDGFSVEYVSYAGPSMQLADGSFVDRRGDELGPNTSWSKTDKAFVRELNFLPPERFLAFAYGPPSIYLELDGLCGGSSHTTINFDYQE